MQKIVLRSKTPDLVRQEFYGLLMAHFAVRGLMHEVALEADGEPDRLSFLHAVRVIRRKMTAYGAIPPCAEESVSPAGAERDPRGARRKQPLTPQFSRHKAQDEQFPGTTAKQICAAFN